MKQVNYIFTGSIVSFSYLKSDLLTFIDVLSAVRSQTFKLVSLNEINSRVSFLGSIYLRRFLGSIYLRRL